MLDIYPEHKNVVVEADAEALLHAINDRAIIILLVPGGPTQLPDVDEVTRRSAERRIDHCVRYALDGQPADADIAIEVPRHPVEDWCETIANSMDSGPETYSLPASNNRTSSITQQYRELSLDRALAHLPPQ